MPSDGDIDFVDGNRQGQASLATDFETLSDRVPDVGRFSYNHGLDDPGIATNNEERILFTASLDDGRIGLFAGIDPGQDALLLSGEQFFDRTIRDLRFSAGGLNDHGQIPVWVEFTDGHRGVYRGDPIPEPSTLALLALGVAGGAWVRRKRGES